MAQTRGATGNSKPRVFNAISTESTRKRKTPGTTATGTKKAKATGTKSTGAGVTKTRAPNTTHKRKPSIKDKVEGAVEKLEGTVERKPGKKAAGARKMRGTDGKNSRTAKVA